MNRNFLINIFTSLVTVLLFTAVNVYAQEIPADKIDSTSTRNKLNDNRLPFQPTENPRGVNMKLPSNYTKSVEYDPKLNEYVFKEKIGKLDYSMPYSMNMQEYRQFEAKNAKNSYWIDRRKADKGETSKSFIPKLNIGGEAFDKIFGTNVINIVPQGSAELIFGVNTSKTENPNISARLQKSSTFDFQQKIQMNVTGNIGDKMKLGINYNTEATFDFENKTKLEYTGKDDEIIRKIEAGNVTLPLSGSLITGSQSLFGLKTELQFGKLTVTSVFSQQKGESSAIEVKGGAQVNEFEIPIDQYDANKHYFLSQFFRNRYEEALKTLPLINSGFIITRMEVWVTNKVSATENVRNIVAFMDLAEGKQFNIITNFKTVPITQPRDSFPRNEINSLYSSVTALGGAYNVRNIKNVASNLSSLEASDFRNGQDYEKMENAKKLKETEYTFNPKLGYISLNSALNSNEILAVAYEYTYQGRTYNVGELSSLGVNAGEALVVKLLKGQNFTPRLPNWKLMMKNVYSLGAYQVSKANFQLQVVYQDDKNGTAINYIPETQTSKKLLLKLLRLDNLNTNNDPTPDGVFDFVEGVTINSTNGRIYFPVLEPFGSFLGKTLKDTLPSSVLEKYVFQELYDNTQTKARQSADKNKFKLKGTYESTSGSDIALNAMNVPQGSVIVTAGGRKLVENADFTVDYALGRVKIIDQGLIESGVPIKISLESNSLFSFQTKTMVGTHLNYKFSNNFNLGATVLNLTERPLTTKVNIGDEPISNTIWGINGTYTTKSQLLTTLIDKLPFIQTKEISSFTVDGEFAHLIPGHSKAINKSGTSYIDDFEGCETSIDLKQPYSWSLASTPSEFAESKFNNDLRYGYNRAKLAWYTIDPLFLRDNSTTPANIRKNKQISPYVTEVYEQDIFKNKDNANNTPSNISVLNLAYYPKERGPYNYETTKVNADGTLQEPNIRWGGIQREVPTKDFEAANVQFIEFWLMDPFLGNSTSSGGNLYFNLGSVSEDVLKDSRKSFENGLPVSADSAYVDTTTVWGQTPTTQSLVDAFVQGAQDAQDVGLDGLNKEGEQKKFNSYLKELEKNFGAASAAYQNAFIDPSTDDFMYSRSDAYDAQSASILDRYKKYNGLEGNSPAKTNTSYTASNSITPNTEDINNDNTLDEKESYFRYKVAIKPHMEVGTNFIVDTVSAKIKDNNDIPYVKWYQFRIPINAYEKIVGADADLNSIQFMRMYLTGFSDSVIMRFARLNLVRDEWRKYEGSLNYSPGSTTTPKTNSHFEISSVNFEENSERSPINYVLPIGITRQTDPQNPQFSLQNEQSMILKVKDLENGTAHAAYKNLNLDIRQYKRLKMEVHAEKILNEAVNNKEMSVFVRLGSDYTNNYYEYEAPLTITDPSTLIGDNKADDYRLKVWPEENRIDISLEEMQQVKQARNDEARVLGDVNSLSDYPYPVTIGDHIYRVRGNPNLSNIRTIMIGVRYPSKTSSTEERRSVEVWVNELRLTDFNEKGGWAANLRTTLKLADLGMVNVSGGVSTPGFGSIDKKIGQRNKEEMMQYDVSTNLELGKFFPKKAGVQIPMYAGISEMILNPQYNPLDPDIELKAALNNAKNKKERDNIKSRSQDRTTRKSLNFTNVKINKQGGKPHFYSVSNLSANYSYSEINSHNINTEYNNQRRYHGGIAYAFQNRPKNIAPFQKLSIFKPNAFRLIKDFNFNYAPTNVSFRTDISRNYTETKVRNLNDPAAEVTPSINKDFILNRYTDIAYDITRSLKIDFSSSNLARIDEPLIAGKTAIDKSFKDSYQNWKDSITKQVFRGGRTTHYQHDINVSYTIPINKLPLLDWTSASAKYTGTYDWDAAPLIQSDTLDFGNTINNTSSISLNGQLNFTSLYNKIPYFKKVMQPQDKAKKAQQKKYKTIIYERERASLTTKVPRIIFHKLSTPDVKVKVTDANGKEIAGKTDIIDDNKVSFTADSSYQGTKIIVEGQVEVKPSPLIFIIETATRAVLGVKNLSVSWSQTDGTALPGYKPNASFVGMDGKNEYYAPGIGFLVGIQDAKFHEKSNENKWLSTNQYFNAQYLTSHTDNLSLRSTIEPIPSLKIELTAARSSSVTKKSIYGYDYLNMTFPEDSVHTQESGNFTTTIISIKGAFGNPINTFNKFRESRNIIAQQLGIQRQKVDPYYDMHKLDNRQLPKDSISGYGANSQEVLIRAFLNNYANVDSKNIDADAIPMLLAMLPNWRITYDGLTKVPFFEKFARTISLGHAYRSTYNVGSYLSNPRFDNIQDQLNYERDLQYNFVPRIDIASVSITEQFGPLISLDINFKNSLSSKFEMRRNRSVILSLVNTQITETSSNELIVGAGYKFNNVQFSIKSGGGQKAFKSDLNLRADLSIRDNKTIIRKLDLPPQPSDGQNIITIKVSADYMLSDRFNIRMFYDRIVNAPFLTKSFKTANTNIGFSVRFTLAQ